MGSWFRSPWRRSVPVPAVATIPAIATQAAAAKSAAVDAAAMEAAAATPAPVLGVGRARDKRQRRSRDQCGRERHRAPGPLGNFVEPHMGSPVLANVIRQVVAGRARARPRTTDATKRMIATPAANCHPTLDSGAGLYGLAGEAVGGFVQTDAGA